jgi:hypothetical protein
MLQLRKQLAAMHMRIRFLLRVAAGILVEKGVSKFVARIVEITQVSVQLHLSFLHHSVSPLLWKILAYFFKVSRLLAGNIFHARPSVDFAQWRLKDKKAE